MTTNYQNGKIYKIEPINGEDGDIYIGSTTKEYLSQRMTAHRSSYNQWKKGKSTNTTSFYLFEKYGKENCNIILLENSPCNSKDQLIAKEAYYIRLLPCINKNIPGRAQKEYKNENKEHIKETDKKYYEAHKIHRALPYNCECGSTCRSDDKVRHFKSKKHKTFLSSQELV